VGWIIGGQRFHEPISYVDHSPPDDGEILEFNSKRSEVRWSAKLGTSTDNNCAVGVVR